MENICKVCYLEKNSHSFMEMKKYNDIRIFYTCPSEAKKYNDKEGILEHYNNMLKQVKHDEKWIWLIDSYGFETKHAIDISLAKGLASLIVNNYFNNLMKIIIINPTWHIKILCNAIIPLYDKKVSEKILHTNKKIETRNKEEIYKQVFI
jgi:hypothetical protein